MGSDAIEAVRRFNRTVTQRIGALDEHYLSRDRPLGEARVLWEVGDDGAEIRVLRERLGLDSGYVSRLLRALESDGLVTTGPADDDRRVRRVRLTTQGRNERAILDARSDEAAGALIESIDDGRRERLVEAMDTVTRLLTSAAVEFAEADPSSPVAQECLRHYYAELGHRFEDGFDPGQSATPGTGGFVAPTGIFVVATLCSEPVGCGGLLFTDEDTAYLKRMWVADSTRGLGIGRRLLAELERRAIDGGRGVIQLETNRALTEAMALYRSAGYEEVESFVDEPYADHWFVKRLR